MPARQGRSDAPRKDDLRNLVICPLSYDGRFMEIFYRGWGVVKQFIAADAQVPKEVFLPVPADRQVARLLAERREFPVLDVIEALEPLAQPQLLQTIRRAAPRRPRTSSTATSAASLRAACTAPPKRRRREKLAKVLKVSQCWLAYGCSPDPLGPEERAKTKR